jgi:hypothetical protein
MRQANPPPLTAVCALYDYGVAVTFRRSLHLAEICRDSGSGNLRNSRSRQGEGGCGFIVSCQGSCHAVEHPATLHRQHIKRDSSLFLPVK